MVDAKSKKSPSNTGELYLLPSGFVIGRLTGTHGAKMSARRPEVLGGFEREAAVLLERLAKGDPLRFDPMWWSPFQGTLLPDADRAAALEAREQGRRKMVEAVLESLTAPSDAKLFCAQCVLNGSGHFPVSKEGKCPNPSCTMTAFLEATNTKGDKKPAAEKAPEGALPAKSCTYDQQGPAVRRAKGKTENKLVSAKGGTLRTSTREASKTDEWEALQKALCESCASAVAHWPSVQSPKPTTKELIEGELWPALAGRVFRYLENVNDEGPMEEFFAGREATTLADVARTITRKDCEVVRTEDEASAASQATSGRRHTAAGLLKIAWARYAGSLLGLVETQRQPATTAWFAVAAAITAKCFAALETRSEEEGEPLFKNKRAQKTWIETTVARAARDLWTAPEGGPNA